MLMKPEEKKGVGVRKLALVGIIPRATRMRKTLGSIPGGAALWSSSDPAVNSSIFVEAEWEEKLIRGRSCWKSR